MKKNLVIFGVVVVLAGLIFYFTRRPSGQIIHPKQGVLTEAVYGLGTVESDERFDLKFGVSTTVAKRLVVAGQDVKSGDSILQLADGRVFASPIDGRVIAVDVNSGELVFPQVSVVTIVNLAKRYVRVSLEQKAALKVRVGQAVRLSCDGLRDVILTGTVDSIYPENSQIVVRISANSWPDVILPEMTVDAAIEVSHHDSATLIPLSCVRNGAVKIRRSGRWQDLPVKIGRVDGDHVEILDGDLSPQDEILIPE